jgi:hypothetical protein
MKVGPHDGSSGFQGKRQPAMLAVLSRYDAARRPSPDAEQMPVSALALPSLYNRANKTLLFFFFTKILGIQYKI